MEKQWSIVYGMVLRKSKTQATDGDVREIRINGFGSEAQASGVLAAMLRSFESQGIEIDNPRIEACVVNVSGTVYP